MMKAIRGATTVAANTPEAIRESTLEMLQAIIKANDLSVEAMISVIFSATGDIDAAYPAKYARELPGLEQVPLFCVQEMAVAGSLPMCLRVLIHSQLPKQASHVYLRGAVVLRPDLTQ